MRLKGFISNRIFDVLVCRGIIITDDVKGIEECLSSSIYVYKDRKDLLDIIEKCMKGEIDKSNIENGYKLVTTQHTFESRIKQILKDLNWL